MSGNRTSMSRLAWALMIFAMLAALPLASRAGVNELVRDTQRTVQTGDDFSMVMWLPNAASQGRLRVMFYEHTLDWRLPLGSLLPVRKDAKTGEEFPGNYSFNPFTGERL